MKKIALLTVICSMLIGIIPSYASENNEYIYVAISDTSVHANQPDTNYGDWTTMQEGGENLNKCIIYCSFDFSELKSDNPQILDPPNPRLGFWYEADLTNSIAKKFNSGLKTVNMQLISENISNAQIMGRFFSREAQFNKPYLKITLSSDNKKLISAKMYIFGGTSSYKVNINELKSSFDESTVTYNTKPMCGERMGFAYRNEAMSGRPESTPVDTIDGMDYETAMSTLTKSFDAQFPDFIKWNEIYDVSNFPTVEQVIDDFKKKNPNGEHPRILGGREEWERTRKWIKEGNKYTVKWSEYVIATADKSAEDMDIPLDFTYNSAGSDMLYKGEDLIVLGMAYQITLDKKYADAAYKKMGIMAGYRHWNTTGKDLNLGTCAKNVGATFDLVYNALTPQERSVIVSAIMRHVIDPRLGKPNNNYNNWNPVTNGGMAIAALAIMNEQPYKAAEMIVQSVSAIPMSLLEYYPDGAFPESYGYYFYMTENLFTFLAAMDSTLGNLYKLDDFPGLSQTPYYLIYMNGPTKKIRFKYGDDKGEGTGSSTLFYMAKKYNNPDFSEYQLRYIEENNRYNFLAPYWCDENTFDAEGMYKRLPKDRTFDGFTPISSMRSAWEDSNALFAAIKGGYPQTSHTDMDEGTFLVAALGVEWSKKLASGPDYQKAVGFPSQFRMTRYMFYGASPQGNNTLLFNPGKIYPDLEYGQEDNTYIRFEKYYSDENCAFSILDMSDAYRKYATKLRRGIALINNRREFLIQDEIESSASNLVYWFMHTDKEAEINGNTAILKDGSKRLYCKILSPQNALFEMMQAGPLHGTPGISDFDEVAYEGEKKLTIKTETTGKDKITVWMVPLTEYDQIPSEEPVLCDIDNWPMCETDITRLEKVKINGKEYEDFSPEKFVYDITTEDKDFNIEAYGENVSVIKIVNSDSVMLKCSSPGKKSARYVFNHAVANDLTKISVTASDIPQLENTPENTLDSDLDTRWASQNKQWILYDLGETALLDSVSVAFYQGSSRMYTFNIEVSLDGESYTKIFDGKSSGITEALEKYSFTKQNVRFVRVNCNGNNENSWNNISEISFGYTE